MRKVKDGKDAEVAETTVNGILAKALIMFDATNPHELKNTLSHFIGRIEIKDQELTIYYSVAPSQSLAVSWRPRGDLNP